MASSAKPNRNPNPGDLLAQMMFTPWIFLTDIRKIEEWQVYVVGLVTTPVQAALFAMSRTSLHPAYAVSTQTRKVHRSVTG